MADLEDLVAQALRALLADLTRPRRDRRPTTLPGMLAEAARAAARARNRTVQTLRWEVNRAANEGRVAEGQRVAAVTGRAVRKVWVAERDACVHCLGLSGQTVALDGGFDPAATFDPRGALPVFGDGLDAPPRHPNCRCQVTIAPVDDGGFAEGLRREAERSIANGYALASEPEAVRLAAAEALISRPNRLPRSVVERARRSVARGEIRRPVPA